MKEAERKVSSKYWPITAILLMICLGILAPAQAQVGLYQNQSSLRNSQTTFIPKGRSWWGYPNHFAAPFSSVRPLRNSAPTAQIAPAHLHTTLLRDMHAPEAFFCRLEWELEKSIKLPFRFRLGSLDYVNRLEGKGAH